MEPMGYTINIDGRWSLEDLYQFPHAYEQVYYALEAMQASADKEVEERISRAFEAFPWQGGYSAVGFYNQLKWATPKRVRPQVSAIQYSSPGYLNLLLQLPQAIQVASTVTALCTALITANKAYSDIYKGLQERKLLRLKEMNEELKLTRKYVEFIETSNAKMASILSLRSLDVLNKRTKNPLVTLKILLSVFRRAKIIADYARTGKVSFPNTTREIFTTVLEEQKSASERTKTSKKKPTRAKKSPRK